MQTLACMSLAESRKLHKNFRRRGQRARTIIGFCVLFVALALSLPNPARASNHYTVKQLDSLAARVGKTFWLSASDGRVPEFLDSPASSSHRFSPSPEDSFVITELAGREKKDPYYEVRFESGKVGYIRPEAFHEALNLTILAADPRADEKEKKDKLASEEKERVAWIQSQPWAPQIKEAAIRKQPMPGLNTGEVKHILGPPMRVTKLRAPSKVDEEHWFYKDGSVLIFRNGLLTKVDKLEKK
jgi:hypothetical protein